MYFLILYSWSAFCFTHCAESQLHITLTIDSPIAILAIRTLIGRLMTHGSSSCFLVWRTVLLHAHGLFGVITVSFTLCAATSTTAVITDGLVYFRNCFLLTLAAIVLFNFLLLVHYPLFITIIAQVISLNDVVGYANWNNFLFVTCFDPNFLDLSLHFSHNSSFLKITYSSHSGQTFYPLRFSSL